jgi:stearoyl-CoA desaturase (delta-9 desaturase)
MAIEGPLIDWASTHRKHHRFSDRPGDPHSPHVDQGAAWRGALQGLAHAHLGWIFRGKDIANPRRPVRVFLVQHATFSINSLCHFFGRRPFATGDESRNLAWLAPLSLGEAWHNNHHAFPTSDRHALGRWQLDPSAWLITALERCRLVWGVVRVTPERQQAKRAV